MKQFGKVVLLTCLAVVVAALVRYSLRRWFPSLYGERKPVALVTQGKSTGGIETVPPVAATTAVTNAPENSPVEDRPYPVGHLWNRRGANTVVMSDGSVLSMAENTEREPRLQRIQRYYVDYEGRRMYYRPHVAAQGSGAKGAPVRPDGPSSTVVASAGPTLAAVSTKTETPVSGAEQGSWVTGVDGVQRLRAKTELAR